MNRVVYIGIDDTDNLNSVGTGRVARGLARNLSEAGLGESLGVSRHQLLVHPDIPYTSHNSCKGLALKTNAALKDLLQKSEEYMKTCFQPGSDPGLFLCEEDVVTKELQSFGLKAEKEVLNKTQAIELAAALKMPLRELGGDGGGIIGAVAAVGLRSTGNNGRLVEVKGIRDLTGLITVEEILNRSDIDRVEDTKGNVLEPDEVVNSLDWIRPTLVNWKAVLRVVRVEDNENYRWVPAEKAFRATGGKK